MLFSFFFFLTIKTEKSNLYQRHNIQTNTFISYFNDIIDDNNNNNNNNNVNAAISTKGIQE